MNVYVMRRVIVVMLHIAAVIILAEQCVYSWESGGPYGGTASLIVFHPTRPAIAFAVAERLYRSINGGKSWNMIDTPGQLDCVVMGRSEPRRVMGFHIPIGESETKLWVYESTNWGQSWVMQSRTILEPHNYYASIAGCAIDPKDSKVIYILVSGIGVFRSTDQGQKWSRVGANVGDLTGRQLVISESNPGTVFVLGASGENIYRSTDSGTSWTGVNVGIKGVRFRVIAADPTNPKVLYGSGKGMFKSTNGGSNWYRLQCVSTELRRECDAHSISVGGAHGQTIIAAGNGIIRSTNAGKTFHPVPIPSYEAPLFHVAADRGSRSVLANGPVGRDILRSVDGGEHWLVANYGFRQEEIVSLEWAVAPRQLVIANGGYEFGKAYQKDASSEKWTVLVRSNVSGAVPDRFNANVVKIHPKDSRLVMALSVEDQKLIITSDGGRTWLTSNVSTAPVISFDPNSEQVIYTSSAKSTDQGRSWRDLNYGTPRIPKAIEIDPSDSSIVYLLDDNVVFVSDDAGGKWRRLSVIPSSFVSTLKIDPENGAVIYAPSQEGVFRSLDRGLSWSLCRIPMADYRITFVSINPSDSRIVYAGGGGPDLFVSDDRGDHWSVVNLNGINSRRINDCLVLPAETGLQLLVGTENGVYTARVR